MSSEYYLFDTQSSHPINEYKPTRAERINTTPNFVLTVTWPRVVLFYHPQSSICRTFRNTFIQFARTMRRRSTRVLIEFYAVSCEVHRSVCEDSGVESVPYVLGYEGGSIEGMELKRTGMGGALDVDYVADMLGIGLNVGNKVDTATKREVIVGETDLDTSSLNQKPKLDGTRQAGGGDDNIDDGDGGSGTSQRTNLRTTPVARPPSSSSLHAAIFHPHSVLSDVYKDATSSFLTLLSTTLIPPLRNEAYDALREFLDLLHWTLPHREMSMLHKLINDLRVNFDKIFSSTIDELRHVIERHVTDYVDISYSDSCQSKGTNGNDAHGAYSCGLWKLFHIVTIGVHTNHKHVMGDLDRVTPGYVLVVLKSFVDQFGWGGCDICRNVILDLLDDCLDSTSKVDDGSSVVVGLSSSRGITKSESRCRNLLSVEHQHTTQSYKKDASDEPWQSVALILWDIHNVVTATMAQVNRDGILIREAVMELLSTIELWPSKVSCQHCYGSVEDEEEGGGGVAYGKTGEGMRRSDGDMSSFVWDENAVLDYLKRIYWPDGIQNPRLVVLDKWDAVKKRRLFQWGVMTMNHRSSSSVYYWPTSIISRWLYGVEEEGSIGVVGGGTGGNSAVSSLSWVVVLLNWLVVIVLLWRVWVRQGGGAKRLMTIWMTGRSVRRRVVVVNDGKDKRKNKKSGQRTTKRPMRVLDKEKLDGRNGGERRRRRGGEGGDRMAQKQQQKQQWSNDMTRRGRVGSSNGGGSGRRSVHLLLDE